MNDAPRKRIARALRNARTGIGSIAITYAIAVLVGAAMANSGNSFALRFRDDLVGNAQASSPILRQLGQGNRVAAAALDAAGNAAAGLLSLIAGYGVVSGYGVAAYRGWIGGVVSVDGAHHSRVSTYYVLTLLLQLIPYSLAGGAGVNLGIAAFTRSTIYLGRRVPWLLVPYEAIYDAGWIYLVSLPLFAIASLYEFLFA